MSRSRLALIVTMTMAAILVFPTAGRTAAHEQIVFSGEADGTTGEMGFWIWCAVDEAGAYDDCAGAIQLDEQHVTRHVDGYTEELAEGQYEIDVESADGSIDCELTNVPPITRGPTNRIDIECSSPSGTATSWDAVIGGNA
jgi:hypothetical protein